MPSDKLRRSFCSLATFLLQREDCSNNNCESRRMELVELPVHRALAKSVLKEATKAT